MFLTGIRYSANVCTTGEGEVGPEPSPVCVQGNADIRRWAKEKIFQSTRFINGGCHIPSLKIFNIPVA